MKRFLNSVPLFRLFLIFAAGLLFSGIAGADDLAPPPWDRLGAANYSTSAEWEFIASGPTPYVADGVEVPLIIGDGGGGFTPDMLPDDDIGWVLGAGCWVMATAAGLAGRVVSGSAHSTSASRTGLIRSRSRFCGSR